MAKTEHFDIGPRFEELLVQLLLTDHAFADQIRDVLKYDYFTLAHLRAITKALFEYHDAHRVYPSALWLQELIVNKTKNDEKLKTQIERYFDKIHNNPMNGDAEGVRTNALEFCRRQNILGAIESILNLTEQQQYDQIASTIQKALTQGAERDPGHIWEERFEERMAEERRKPVATPWEAINMITAGGLSPGELGVILALTGVGKSHALVDAGAHAAMMGKIVVHLTFELSEIKTGKRYDARISGVPYDELKLHQEFVKQRIDALPGKIRIKKYPNRKASVQTVRGYLSKLNMEGVYPDLLIIDYADIMKSTKTYENKRFEEEAVYEELRSLADELNLPIWTAAQVNRSGMDVEVLTLKHIAECFNKSMVADLFITMNRRKNGDDETLGNFFVAKNRNGSDGLKFNILVNTALSRIQCLTPGSIEEQEANLKFDLGLETDPQERMRKKLRKMRTTQEQQMEHNL